MPRTRGQTQAEGGAERDSDRKDGRARAEAVAEK